MDETQINAIEMTRKIRDEHAEQLAGKSHAERIAFFRERADKMESNLSSLLSELAAGSSGRGDYSKDRRQWLDGQNMDTVLQRIRERRAAYKK